ncbi:MAG: phosphoribosylglycinamide formyltransferase [Maricaulaceae bacterium]
MSVIKPIKRRVAILISGRGSNMVALANAALDPDYPAEIAIVISNRPNAAGLDKAREMGIEAVALDHKDYQSRESFENDLHEALIDADIELVCCAGFMRVLTPFFTRLWPGRLMNIHPSLLPKYKGLHTHKRALDAGDKTHGCTVHYVNEELDGGAVIKQASIDIHDGDTAETLATRLIPIEHELYVKSLRHVCETI